MKNPFNSVKVLNWPVIAIICLGNIGIGLILQGFSVLLPFIQSYFNISNARTGFYFTILYFSSFIFAIFAGRIVDILGSRKGISWGLCGMGLLLSMHFFSPNLLILLILAFLIGINHSTITPALNKGLVSWVPAGQRAISLGISQSGKGIGGFLAASLFPLVATIWGWRIAVLFPGLFTLGIGLFINYWLSKQNKYDDNCEKGSQGFSIIENFRLLYQDKRLLLICFLGFIFGSSKTSIMVHYTLFLYHDQGLSKELAALGLGLVQLGGIIGRPFWGLLSDKYFKDNRKQVLYFLASSLVLLFLATAYFSYSLKLSIFCLFFFAFIIGISSQGWDGTFYTVVAESVESKNIGIATGLALVFVRLGHLSSPTLFGLIADLSHSYQLSWYIYAVMILIILSIVIILQKNNDKLQNDKI